MIEPMGNVAVASAAGTRLAAIGAGAQLAGLLEQTQSVTRQAQALVLGRSPKLLGARCAPESWSVAECFAHLAQTSCAFLPAIFQALAEAPEIGSERRLRTGTLAWWFVRNLEPPYRIRLKVLKQLAPQHREFEGAWQAFLDSQSQLTTAIQSASGLAIDKVRVKSPVYARFSYNVYGALCMLVAHERRHLWQVQQILEELERQPIASA